LKFLPDKRLYSNTSYCLSKLKAMTGGGNTPSAEIERFHFYWRGSFGRKQAFALKSLLATQQIGTFELWLWLDHQDGYEGHAENPLLRPLLPLISVKRFVPEDEARGTPLEGRAEHWNCPAVKLSNFLRHVVLFKYGGTYIDVDTAILRDLSDLRQIEGMEPEFTYQWSDRPWGNSAVLRLRKESSVALALLMSGLAKGNCDPRTTLQFADNEALDLLILPAPFFDPLWLSVDRADRRFRAPFATFSDFFRAFDAEFPRPRRFRDYRDFFAGAFAHHWHNQWTAPELANSYYGVLDSSFQDIMDGGIRSRSSPLSDKFRHVMNRARIYVAGRSFRT
jgi:hypothetical protein